MDEARLFPHLRWSTAVENRRDCKKKIDVMLRECTGQVPATPPTPTSTTSSTTYVLRGRRRCFFLSSHFLEWRCDVTILYFGPDLKTTSTTSAIDEPMDDGFPEILEDSRLDSILTISQPITIVLLAIVTCVLRCQRFSWLVFWLAGIRLNSGSSNAVAEGHVRPR